MPHRPGNNKPQKSWKWTLNNYTDAEERTIQAWSVSRSIYGRETAPSTGTEHLEGLTVFKKAMRFTAVKKLLPRAHWEPCIDVDAAWNYCSKEGDFWYTDNRVGAGKRTDWVEFRDLVQSGASDADLLMANPSLFMRYGNGIDRARSAVQEPRHEQTECEWYYGETGSGKSTYVADKYPNADWCSITRSGFLQGYHNAEVVVFDDPDLVAFQRELFLNLINHTPFVANVKGSSATFNAKKVIILSNTHPDLWHGTDPAVQRRIMKRFHCEKTTTPSGATTYSVTLQP